MKDVTAGGGARRQGGEADQEGREVGLSTGKDREREEATKPRVYTEGSACQL